MSGERVGPGCAIGSCLGCLMWIAIIVGVVIAISGCAPPTAWKPDAGKIGVSVECSVPSQWTFALDGNDLGTWDAEPPLGRLMFPASPDSDHVMMTWERTPQNIMTFVLGVRAGTTVHARCG